jgi:hypothetical protein
MLDITTLAAWGEFSVTCCSRCSRGFATRALRRVENAQ